MTTIEDVLTYADGSKANGRLAVFWRPFTIGNANVTGGELVYDIVDGAVLVTVYPNAGALPSGSYYSAKYELENGVVYVEQWVVPNLPMVNLGQVRVSFPPTPSILISPTQLTSMNAQPGMFLMWDGVRWVPGYPSTFNLNPNWIGINIGGLGSDVNVVGSPVSVGNYATIHIPDAGPAARGVVTTAAQTIGGAKTFQNTATISQSLLFTQHTVYTAIRGELVNIGSGAAHALNFGGDIVALRIAGTDRMRMQADRLVGGHLDLDTIADPPTATMPGSSSSPLKGAETISLPHDGMDWAGIGMATDGSLWLRTGGAFLYLNPNGVTCRELRMDPYQHPNAAGTEAARSDASMVMYSDSTSWGGYGVDNTPQLWFRMGPNAGAAYYYFGSGGATFPSLTVANLTVSGSLVVPPGAGLIPTYWVDGLLAGTRPILNFISGENIGITGLDISDHNRVDLTINSGGTSGAIADPTDTIGDLIVRGAPPPAAVTKLGVGANGTVLTADNTVITGIKWAVATVGNDSSTQRLRISKSAALQGTRQELNLIPGANVTLTVVDNPGNNRVDVTVAVGSTGVQTPWTSDIDAAGFRLKNTGNVGIGNDLSVLPNTGVNLHLVVGGSSPNTFGRVTAASSGAAIGINVGAFTFANYAIPGTDKRICQIVGQCDGAIDSGALLFYTFVAAAALERMRISAAGSVGIGTSTPSYPLHVARDVTRQLSLSGATSQNANLLIGFDVSNNTGVVEAINAGSVRPLLLNPQGGNVGIGTTAPGNQLTIIPFSGNATTPAAANQFAIGEVSNNSLYRLTLGFYTDGTTFRGVIQSTNNGPASGSLLLNPLGGNVGIGLTNPSRLLQVQSAAGVVCSINFTQAGWASWDLGTPASSGDFVITQVGTAERVRITNAGNVGIGTSAPSHLLHLVGTGTTNRTLSTPLFMGRSASTFAGISTSGVVVADPVIYCPIGTDDWAIGFDNGTSLVERVRFQQTGNVGIGTVPQFRFDVNGGRSTFSPASETYALGLRYQNGGPVFWVGADLNGDMIFSEAGGVERMRVRGGSGTVGIGGVVPLHPLQIVAANPANFSNATQFWISEASMNPAYGLSAGFYNEAATGKYQGVIQAWNSTAALGVLLLNPAAGSTVGIGLPNPLETLHVAGTGIALTSGNSADHYRIYPQSDQVKLFIGYWSAGNWVSGQPTITVLYTGQVGIQRPSPGYALDVAGDVNCSGAFRVNGAVLTSGIAGMMVQINGGGPAGPFTFLNYQAGLNIVLTGSTGGTGGNTFTVNIGSSSDRRLKRNIEVLSGGLSIIGRLRPITAEWNGLADTREGQRVVSIIAQELQSVIPDAVAPFRAKLRPGDSEETELLAYDPMAITAHLILAVQQLEQRLRVLEQPVN
jgi:hypothetical protein